MRTVNRAVLSARNAGASMRVSILGGVDRLGIDAYVDHGIAYEKGHFRKQSGCGV